MSAEKIVESTRTAAFSRGPDGAITSWNRGAEKLFALPAESALGRKCHKVMAGCDLFGNDYCCAECASWRMTESDRLVHPYRLTVKESGGRSMTLRVSILAVRSPEGTQLVHLLDVVFGAGVFAVVSDEYDEENDWGWPCSILTRRELQVLRHMAVGYSTDQIARQLLISSTSVRNYVSRCLQKLEAHSRVEAVAAARRLDLV